MSRRVLRFGMILDDAFALNENDAKRSDDAAVRDGVPREAQPQDVNEDSEEDNCKIAYHLVDGSSEDVALELLLALPGRLYAREQVYHDRQQHQDEAHEHYHDSMADILGYVKMQVHNYLDIGST